jgi:hypothetical protein
MEEVSHSFNSPPQHSTKLGPCPTAGGGAKIFESLPAACVLMSYKAYRFVSVAFLSDTKLPLRNTATCSAVAEHQSFPIAIRHHDSAKIPTRVAKLKNRLRNKLKVDSDSDLTHKIATNVMTHIDDLKGEIKTLTDNKNQTEAAARTNQQNLNAMTNQRDAAEAEGDRLQVERDELIGERNELKKQKQDVKDSYGTVEKGRKDIHELMRV